MTNVICCSFIFTPKTYDEEFHRLNDEIEAFARALDGFIKTEIWNSEDRETVNACYFFSDMAAVRQLSQFSAHRIAKGKVDKWYESYEVIISEVTHTYGSSARESGYDGVRPTE